MECICAHLPLFASSLREVDSPVSHDHATTTMATCGLDGILAIRSAAVSCYRNPMTPGAQSSSLSVCPSSNNGRSSPHRLGQSRLSVATHSRSHRRSLGESYLGDGATLSVVVYASFSIPTRRLRAQAALPNALLVNCDFCSVQPSTHAITHPISEKLPGLLSCLFSQSISTNSCSALPMPR